MELRVDPEELVPASRSLLALAEEVGRVSSRLGAEVAACAPALPGEATTSAFEAWRSWSGALDRLRDGYAHLGEALARVEGSYRDTDASVMPALPVPRSLGLAADAAAAQAAPGAG